MCSLLFASNMIPYPPATDELQGDHSRVTVCFEEEWYLVALPKVLNCIWSSVGHSRHWGRRYVVQRKYCARRYLYLWKWPSILSYKSKNWSFFRMCPNDAPHIRDIVALMIAVDNFSSNTTGEGVMYDLPRKGKEPKAASTKKMETINTKATCHQNAFHAILPT